MTTKNINELINKVVATYKEYGSSSNEFKSIYYSNLQTLEAHKIQTLKTNKGKALNVYGYLVRRGDGQDKNLNLLSPLWINGTQVEHLHVYDGVIEALEKSQEINSNGMFSTNNLEVYSYLRSDGSEAYGIKPIGEAMTKYAKRKKN